MKGLKRRVIGKFNWRFCLVILVFLSLFSVILSRLFFLQIMNHKLYQAQALGQQVDFSVVKGKRGNIFCQNTQSSQEKNSSFDVKTLATNKDSFTIAVDPSLIKDKQAMANILYPFLDKTPEEVVSIIETEDQYAVLDRDMSFAELESLKKSEAKNIFWSNNPARMYPQGDLASQLIGFLGGEGTGQYGIEGYYEEELQGKDGIQKEVKGLDALFQKTEENLDGTDLYLAVDCNIQFKADELLLQAREKFGIASGQIIVADPSNGKILALSNYPSFNINEYGKQEDLEIFQNGAVQKLFEPGSIMKPFTMAAALEEKKITPNTTYIDEGFVKFGKDTIRNFGDEVHGKKTMTEVLESSINTGAVFAMEQVGRAKFLEYIKRFGFLEKTGVDVQGEVFSRNNSLMNNAPKVNVATASFGQGIEITPMQVMRAYSALANGGKIITPHVVDKMVKNGEETKVEAVSQDNVISKETFYNLREMMVSTVEKGVNGYAKIEGYYIAGKTGTAQVPLIGKRGYDPDKTIQSFVGFGPAYNPKFLIMVKLDEPSVSSSSLSAVPVFKDIAKYIINYWQIPPDYDSSSGEKSKFED